MPHRGRATVGEELRPHPVLFTVCVGAFPPARVRWGVLRRRVTMAASPRAEVECPCGHTLSRWRNRAPNLVCDGGACDGPTIAIRAWRWSCSLCDYDVCEVCASSLAIKRGGGCKQASAETEVCVAVDEGEPADVVPDDPPPLPKVPLVP